MAFAGMELVRVGGGEIALSMDEGTASCWDECKGRHCCRGSGAYWQEDVKRAGFAVMNADREVVEVRESNCAMAARV